VTGYLDAFFDFQSNRLFQLKLPICLASKWLHAQIGLSSNAHPRCNLVETVVFPLSCFQWGCELKRRFLSTHRPDLQNSKGIFLLSLSSILIIILAYIWTGQNFGCALLDIVDFHGWSYSHLDFIHDFCEHGGFTLENLIWRWTVPLIRIVFKKNYICQIPSQISICTGIFIPFSMPVFQIWCII